MILRFIQLFLLVLYATIVRAQDVHFSQSYNNVVNVHPSTTAVLPYGIARVSAAYRTQWSAVPVPYSTTNFNGELAHNWLPLPKIQQGLGLTIYTDKAGDGNLKQTHVALNNSFRKNIGDSTCYVAVGTALGYHQWSVQESKLKFTSQFVGEQYNASNRNNENFARASLGYLDVNVGVSGYKKIKRTQLLAGIALQHINKPKQSFYAINNVLSYKSIFTLQATQTLSNSVQLLANHYSAFQGKYNEQITSVRVLKNLRVIQGAPFNIGGGIMYRWKDAPILALGVDYRHVHAEVSYDVNTSGLKQATNGRGATEIFVSYIINLQKIKIPTRTTCPVFI
jgi:type IX secretion system PorP/SprF family membrane protein